MAAESGLRKIALEEKTFVPLLESVLKHTKSLQNHPPDLIPQEDLVADTVVKYLEPYSNENGPLKVRKVTYKEGRSNVIITYPGSTDKVVSFVGSHMDVVPANPEEWERDPFKLTRDGDKLYGRGVTDCLGHVCVLTEVFKQLAVHKPVLKRSVICVLIANEENGEVQGVGIDALEKAGELKACKNGPLFWIDSANFGPTLGTAGVCAWEMTVTGKKFHSGLPHKAVNAIELAMEVVRHIQTRFYKDFSVHAGEEEKYKFNVGSSFKPTQIKTPPGSLNQIPGACTVSGDVRHTPFYTPKFMTDTIEKYIAELDVTKLPSMGYSKFEVEDCKGAVSFKWLGAPMGGVATDLESPGYAALTNALIDVRGKAEPFSLTGSLPIIGDLKAAGYDVQITGFGRMEAYHANNEYALLSELMQGAQVVARVIEKLEASA